MKVFSKVLGEAVYFALTWAKESEYSDKKEPVYTKSELKTLIKHKPWSEDDLIAINESKKAFAGGIKDIK